MQKNTFSHFFRLLMQPRWHNHRLRFYVLAAIIFLSEVAGIIQPMLTQKAYALGGADTLLPAIDRVMSDRLTHNPSDKSFSFKSGDAVKSQTSAQSGAAQVTASAFEDPSKGISVNDPVNKVDFKLTPKHGLLEGRKDGNRIVYPADNGNGWTVYTMQGTGVKEDVIINNAPGDTMSIDYTMALGSNLEARLQSDGSIGIFGNTLFAGSVATSSEKDAELLDKARKNASKDTLLFSIPRPVVIEANKKVSEVKASFELQGSDLKINVSNMKKGHYPLSVDPSIYVVTAQQFMAGNNETNINFDVDNKLIKKGRTTGARFDTWNTTTPMPNASWGVGTAVTGGYIYSIGGGSFSGKTFTAQGSDTFTVPSGVTNITFKMWGAGGGSGSGGSNSGGGAGGGGGYLTSTVTTTPGESLSVYVGGGGGGGNKNSSSAGGGGGGYSSLYRGSTPLAIASGGGGGGGGRTNAGATGGNGGGGGGTTGVTGSNSVGAGGVQGGAGGTQTAGGLTGFNGCGATGDSPGSSLRGGNGLAKNIFSCSTAAGSSGGLATGGTGGTLDNFGNNAGGGGGGSGWFGGGGGAEGTGTGGGGGGGGSSYINPTGSSATTNSAASGVNAGNASDSLRNNAGQGAPAVGTNGTGTAGKSGLIVITYGTGNAPSSSTVNWAKFNTSTGTVDSADPGNGSCSGWCTTSAYSMPGNRANFSLVAYNGFLYAIGGTDTTCTAGSGTCSTVYIAKLGANGEPQLWHPTDANKANWSFWYQDTGLTSPRAYSGAVAYNNRMYLVGGLSGSSAVNSVQVADITPTGQLSSWTTSSASLPTALYGHSLQVYNDKLYVLGGASSVGGSPVTNTYYNKINSDGSLNTWVPTTALGTARFTNGGNFATVWGAYMYVSGGCSALNSSGYCTAVSSDTQVASINADGSLDVWNTVGGVTNQVTGAGLVTWRDRIYQIGGCSSQNTATGDCIGNIQNTIQYGYINQDGDASTVGQSVASGTAPCSGANPTGCNLPGQANIGNMLSAAVITNGYLYVIGGCTNNACTTTSSNVAYASISSTGNITKPATCPSGAYQGGMWCVDTVHTVAGGIAASSPVVFGGSIYLVGGLNGNNNTGNIFRATANNDGTISAWTSQTLASVGATSVSYQYAYARANPSSASTTPGNLYIFGGCTTSSGGAGCTAYTQNVYKCNLLTDTSVSGCTTSGQLQIGTIPGDTVGPGLAIMSGTVYANYVYLIGGVSPGMQDLATIRYAKIDNNNNVVTVSSGWTESATQMNTGRRRAAAFGYNGYIYIVGGYEASAGTLPDIEFAKINVSDGSLSGTMNGSQSVFNTSKVQINQRWGLTVPVSNSFAYVIGGCTVGASPGNCTTRTDVIQTFQIYNNDSGAPAGFSTAANTYGSPTGRLGHSGVVSNGNLYVAGGCTSTTTDCSATTSTVSYAKLNIDGSLGTWSNTSGSLPAGRAWGKLLSVNGALYYIGGQDNSGVGQSTVYYGVPSGTGDISSWSAASNSLPTGLTQIGAASWNGRIYVTGGSNKSQNGTASYLGKGADTFTVPQGVTSITVRSWGAGGGGGSGNNSTGVGGSGGGGGFAQSTLTVTPGETLNVTIGAGGKNGTSIANGGNGGGYSSLQRSSTFLIQAGGGAGGSGTIGTGNGNIGGTGGGATGGAGGNTNGAPGGTAIAGGAGGGAGTGGAAGISGAANAGGDAASQSTSCATVPTTRGSAGFGGGGAGGVFTGCAGGGGGGGGAFGGGGGGSANNGGAGAGGGGSGLATGTGITLTSASASTAANNTNIYRGTAGNGGSGGTGPSTSTAGSDGAVVISYTPQSFTNSNNVYVSPLLNGGDITSGWSSSSTPFNVARSGATAIAYANNLYVFGGTDGANYFSDSQYAQINPTTGNVGSWTNSESLPSAVSQADGFANNGYIYLIGGKSSVNSCTPSTYVAPISANTTIASGNNPTGIGSWYETNQSYTGSRYGAAAVYNDGKAYVLGGSCNGTMASPVIQQTTLLTQPQVARYSIMIDTDSDVFPNKWLLNGVDNSIGARWQLKYRSMSNPSSVSSTGGSPGTNCSATQMNTWGQDTNFGNVTLGLPGAYIPKDGSGNNMNCARYYYFNVGVDISQSYGYPDDVSRGPTITDLTLQFTADPSKRLMHGRTFTGGLQQPDDTPYYTN